MLDYYAILEVHPKASQEVIKRAYLVLAKKYHPDTSGFDKAYSEQKIKEINEAYSVLSDVDKRKEYDKKYFFSSKNNPNYDHDEKTENPSQTHENGEGASTNHKNRDYKWLKSIGIIIIALLAFYLFKDFSLFFAKRNPVESDGSMILATAKVDGKWGVIDVNGDWVIQPKFLSIGEFSEGMAPALDAKTERWGFIDKTGKWLIEPKYYDSKTATAIDSFGQSWVKRNPYVDASRSKAQYGFSNGLAPVMTSESRCGYINKRGEMVIDSVFSSGYPFKNGVAIVTAGISKTNHARELYGAIDKNNKFLIPIRTGIIESFSDGLFLVEIADGWQWGYAKPFDSYICSDIYDEATEFSEGLAIVKVNGSAKLINKNFKVIKDLSYISDGDRISCDDGGYKEGKLMLTIKYGEGDYKTAYYKKVTINRMGKQIKNDFKETNGLYRLKDISSGKYGFVDENDTYVIDPQFDSVSNFSEGVAVVTVNKKCGLIDVTGKYIKEPTYDYLMNHSSGFIIAGWDNKVGVLDLKGNVVISNKFQAIKRYKRVKKEDLNL